MISTTENVSGEAFRLRHRLLLNSVLHAALFAVALLVAYLIRYDAGSPGSGAGVGNPLRWNWVFHYYLPWLPYVIVVKLLFFGRAKLLRGLQVTEDPATVQILGRSEFQTTDPVRPDDGSLAAFARKIGATTVVWTSKYRGRRDTVVDEPVTEWRTGTITTARGRHTTFTESSTVWYPVLMKEDEYAFVAFFLRQKGP